MKRVGLNEREIIAVLKELFETKPRLPLGFDDDLASYPFGKGQQVIVKTDMLVGGTDVPPGMTVRQAARKAVVATVSDFAAKGVKPRILMIGLGLSPPVKLRTVKEIGRGLGEGAREYGCRIIGGDTSETSDLIIDCIGIGLARNGKIIPRNGAIPGDIVAVTGDFGRTVTGLRILTSKSKKEKRKYPTLVHAVLHPTAQLRLGLRLAKTGYVNSSIDSSDGLAWSLSEIAKVSRVNIVIEKVPIAKTAKEFANKHRLDPEEIALYGGEEYELVMTISRDQFESMKNRAPGLRKIGRVEKGPGKVSLVKNGQLVIIEPRGYQHFE
jgi:thiamine-monophosphate kinase